MKKLICFLIAFGSFPTALNAESTWLIIRYQSGASWKSPIAMEKIEMENAFKCESEGRKWENSPTQGEKSWARRFHCVVGK